MNATQSPYLLLHRTFLGPVERLLDKKRRYLTTLESKDRMAMSEADAARCTTWIKAVGEEIEVIENMVSASEEMIQLIAELNEHVTRAGHIIHDAQTQYNQLMKAYLTMKQHAEGLEFTESFFMKLANDNLCRK